MHKRLSKIELIIARSPAALLIKRHKKHHDVELYRVLADCMEIAEVCERDPAERKVLDGLIAQMPMRQGQTRQYIERGSDIYQRVCRFMFHGEEHNANTNRYAHCLREAARQGITHATVVQELNSGGINKFYLVRPSQRTARQVATKCLHLDRVVTHSQGEIFTLKLKRGEDGIYVVLSFGKL